MVNKNPGNPFVGRIGRNRIRAEHQFRRHSGSRDRFDGGGSTGLTVENVNTGLSKVYVTNNDIYDTSSIVAGTYKITFAKSGFSELVRSSVRLNAENTTIQRAIDCRRRVGAGGRQHGRSLAEDGEWGADVHAGRPDPVATSPGRTGLAEVRYFDAWSRGRCDCSQPHHAGQRTGQLLIFFSPGTAASPAVPGSFNLRIEGWLPFSQTVRVQSRDLVPSHLKDIDFHGADEHTRCYPRLAHKETRCSCSCDPGFARRRDSCMEESWTLV